MADGTKIEWTDATANYVNGCSVLSPGCTNCYAMRMAGTRLRSHPTREGLTRPSRTGPVWTGKVRRHLPVLDQVLRWRRPRKIFWNAHGDIFHENVPDEWIDAQFAVMALTPQHQHQVLTKRSARMRAYLAARKAAAPIMVPLGDGTLVQHPFNRDFLPPQNVWLGVSVEDQARANERMPDLLATPAAVRWVSGEPLLGPLDFTNLPVSDRPLLRLDALRGRQHCGPAIYEEGARLDWIVVGGESGPRPMHPDWVRAIRDQCAAAGTAFLFKQWGSFSPMRAHLLPVPREKQAWVRVTDGRAITARVEADLDAIEREEDRAGRPLYSQMLNVGKAAAGRELDGVLHDGYPA